MLLDIALIFLSILITLITTSLVGSFFKCLYSCNSLRQSSLYNTFFNIITGSVIIVSVAALYFTGFKTVFAFTALTLTCYFLVNTSTRKNLKLDISTHQIVSLSLVSLFATISTFVNEYNEFLFGDTIFYSNIANHLSKHGNENFYHYYNLSETKLHGVTPYHYFELWLSSVIDRLNPFFNSFLTLKYTTYPFFKACFYLGLASIAEHFYQNREGTSISYKLLSIAFLFGFISFYFIDDYLPIVSSFNAGLFGRPNYPIYFFFLIAFLLLFLKRSYSDGLLILSMLPIATITALPSVAPSFIFILVYLKWRNLIDRKEFFILLSYGIVTFFGIGIFYILLGPEYSPVSLSLNEITSTGLALWKAILGQALFTLIALGLPISILWILQSRYQLNRVQPIIVMCCLLLISGFCAFQALTPIHNSYQFMYIGFAVLHLLLLTFALFFFRKFKLVRWALISAALVSMTLMLKERLHFKLLVSSSNLIEYNSKLRGLSDGEIETLEEISKDAKVAVFDISQEAMNNILPVHRDFLTMPVPNYLFYFNSDLQLYPVVDQYKIYGKPIDTIKFKKAYNFNSRLKFYRDSMSVEEYMDFVDADFLIKTYKPNSEDNPSFEIIKRKAAK